MHYKLHDDLSSAMQCKNERAAVMTKKARKDEQIVVRVSAETKEKAEKKAKSKKVKPAVYVRELIEADLNQPQPKKEGK